MRLEVLQERLRGIPHSGPETGAVLYRTVLERGYRSCLELGFAHGVGTCYIAGALEAQGAGRVTAVDLPGAERRQPRAADLLLELGLSARAELVVSQSSYTWFLMSELERRDRSFDFCFLDGSHQWETDGLAVLLLERLLNRGGMIVLDDLDWTFAASPTLRDSDRVRTMPEAERTTPQVRKVFELLLTGNPAFAEVYERDGLGFAVKA
jgi:predicted O-methyltransferase YrrM